MSFRSPLGRVVRCFSNSAYLYGRVFRQKQSFAPISRRLFGASLSNNDGHNGFTVGDGSNHRASLINDMADYRDQLRAPDRRSDCGIFAWGGTGPSVKIPDVLDPVVEELKARYHTTVGGGDGGGVVIDVPPSELAEFYGCDESLFRGAGRLIQVTFSRNKPLRQQQLYEFKTMLKQLGLSIESEVTPQTDFSCLRDGQNNEKDRQGWLMHVVVKLPTQPAIDDIDNRLRQWMISFNISEKAKDLGSDNYSPASIDAITHHQLVCKSFKGDAILDLFPFLNEFSTTHLRFHGREATNTQASRFSIHPTFGLNIMHNGEINNIQTLRIFLSRHPKVRSWLNGDANPKYADVINTLSDTTIFSIYVSFRMSLGDAIDDIMKETFLSNSVSYSKGFVAEGPASMMLTIGDTFYLINDSQAQRPAYLHILKNAYQQITDYRVGSVAGLTAPVTGEWQKVHVQPATLITLTPTKDAHGAILYYTLNTHTASKVDGVHRMAVQTSNESSLPDLVSSQGLHRVGCDESVKVAMGSQRMEGPFPRMATAGITNTSLSRGIDPSHEYVLLNQPNGHVAVSPIVTHGEYEHIMSWPNTQTILAVISEKKAQSLVKKKEGFESVLAPILAQTTQAVTSGMTTIELRFIHHDNVPLFPREWVVDAVSRLLCTMEVDGMLTDEKVNLVVTTHATHHAQDAFSLINMGADVVYFPHFKGDDYLSDIQTLRDSLMTLVMRTGVSRLSQLKNAGLIHYEGMKTLAETLNVTNSGGDEFSEYDALRVAMMQRRGLGADYGVTLDSNNQKLTPEMAVMMQDSSTQRDVNRRLNIQSIYPFYLKPTPKTTLKPIVVVYGAGPAGISYVETLPSNHYKVVLVERKGLHRGGNARFISGDHISMYQSFLHRFNAVLDRPDVTYIGGARQTLRDIILELADHIVDARGSVMVPHKNKHVVPAQPFLEFAYNEALSSDQAIKIPDHFVKPSVFPGIVIQGMGNVSWDILKALLGLDQRVQNPSRLFQKWRAQFKNRPIYVFARRGPEALIWKESWLTELAEFSDDVPFRMITTDMSDIPQAFHSNVLHPSNNPPSDGINLVFHAQPDANSFDANDGVVAIKPSVKHVWEQLPFIGTFIEGFVNLEPPPSLNTTAPITTLGWSESSGSMANIMERAQLLSPPDYAGFGSVNDRDQNSWQLDDFKKGQFFVSSFVQRAINQQLIENPDTSDASLTSILRPKSDTPPSNAELLDNKSSLIDPVDADAPSSMSQEYLDNHALAPNMLQVISSKNGKILHILTMDSNHSSVLETLTDALGVNMDDFDCGGGGTCSTCSADVRANRLPAASPSERALTGGIRQQMGSDDVRLLCQLNNKIGDGLNIVPAPFLLKIILENAQRGGKQ